MKKLLAVGIIVLFIGASVVPSTGMVEKLSNQNIYRAILYVGGSGSGNYTKIRMLLIMQVLEILFLFIMGLIMRV